MMKQYILLSILLLVFANCDSQNIGVGTGTPNASALLDITSTTKGLLIPRMTSVQRTNIATPATGLLVFDTDTKTIWAYDGAAWKNLYSVSGSLSLPFSQTINTVTSALQVTNQGLGAALEGVTTNEFGIGITARANSAYGWGLNAFTNGPGGTSVRSTTDSGIAFHGENMYPGNTNTLMTLLNRGIGKTVSIQMANSNNPEPNVQIAGNGKGKALVIYQTNQNNSVSAVDIQQSGFGTGLNIEIVNATNHNPAITANGAEGYGVYGSSNGVSNAGIFGINLNTGNCVEGYAGVSASTSIAGSFSNVNPVNSSNVLESFSNGTGTGLVINNVHIGTINNLAIFKRNSVNVARIDETGKGFFNGGTQNGGADVAEAFDVKGDIQHYEPGDVLVIATDEDRMMEKSSQPYSNLVAGVYATRPGVLLTEENIDTDLPGKVPMGVIGVIPTKVCLEGGEIKRGNMLVTSSIPGVAMKGDPALIKTGQVIGKALQHYSSNGIEKIKVLVSIK